MSKFLITDEDSYDMQNNQTSCSHDVSKHSGELYIHLRHNQLLEKEINPPKTIIVTQKYDGEIIFLDKLKFI